MYDHVEEQEVTCDGMGKCPFKELMFPEGVE